MTEPAKPDELRQRLKAAGETGAERVAPMPVTKPGMFKLTAGELRQACKACPAHYLAPGFLKSVATFPDGKEVIIERIDLEAMMDNKNVLQGSKLETTDGGGTVKVLTKTLVEFEDSSSTEAPGEEVTSTASSSTPSKEETAKPPVDPKKKK